MSLTKTQIDALARRTVKQNSVSWTDADLTADENIALDRALAIIFGVNGKWQFDDSNHTDYPIISTNLVANQRDYTFTTDGSGNLILDIYKVIASDSSGNFNEIKPVDVQTDQFGVSSFYDGQNTTGTPYRYDKTANGIFLDPIPNYNYTNGLKIYINREASYFLTTDTTKKPGFNGLFHDYIALYASYLFAMRNNLPNLVALKREVDDKEQKLSDYYASRGKDDKRILTPYTPSAE